MHAHSTRARASTAPACPGWGPGRPSRPSASEQPWLAGLRVGVGNYSASSISSAWLVQSIRACLCCVVGWLWWVRWHGRGYRQQAVTRSRQGKGQCMHTAPDTACPAARYAPVCETGWYMYAWGASSPGSKDRTLPLSSQKARTHATEAKASDPVWMGVGVGGSGSEAASCESAQTRTRVSPNRGRSIDRSTSSSRPLILCDVGCVWRACLPLLAGSERTTILGSSSSIDLGRGRSIRTQSKRQPGVWFQATAQKPETQSKTACWRRPGPGRPARHVGDCSSGCPLRASNQGAPGAIFLLVARFFSISRRPGLRTRHPQESTQGYRLRLTQTWGGCMVACPFVGVEVSTPPPASCPGSGDR